MDLEKQKLTKEAILYNYFKDVNDGKITLVEAIERLTVLLPNTKSASFNMGYSTFKDMLEGNLYKRKFNKVTTLYFIEKIGEDFGKEKLFNALDATLKNTVYYYSFGGAKSTDLRNKCSDIAIKNNINIDFSDAIFKGVSVKSKTKDKSTKTIPQLPAVVSYAKNQILYGPPGTGKTYNTINYAVAIIEGANIEDILAEDRSELLERYKNYKSTGLIDFCTFHQSYGYEEFIEGIKPSVDANGNIVYKVKSGIFKQFCEHAQKNPEKNFVFIIDEINRGNISKIFGELITLIESSKRLGETEEILVRLPYSNDMFGIPNNVYVIGTMNTADRSIALIDTALRRRFEFIEMQPNIELLENVNVVGIEIAEVLNTINRRIEVLYDRNHTIGHSFFIGLNENSTVEDLKNIFMQNILPLLQEYFYDDFEKIAIVLGDDVNSSDLNRNFITKQKGNYANVPDFDNITLPAYKVNEQAFNNAEAYIKIYKV